MDLKHRLLHRLDMKGIAEADELATELDATPANVRDELEDLRERGHVESEGFWYITSEGKAQLTQSLRDRFTSDQIEQLQTRIDEFETLDAEFKELAGEWQSVDDRTANEELIDRLREIHRQVETFFREFEEPIYAEYNHYLDDLESALAELEAGNEEYFTGAEVSSYHTVWFRLHDDLLRTLGIERDE